MAQNESRSERMHRNNAAEWIMVIALTPIAWLIRFGRFVRDLGETPAEKPPVPRQRSLVEGLPPRTMN